MSLVFLLGEMGNTEHSNGGFRKYWECACVRVCVGGRARPHLCWKQIMQER